MNNRKILIGAGAFLAVLWAVVVTTYASQMRRGEISGKIQPLQATSCSSSSSGGTE